MDNWCRNLANKEKCHQFIYSPKKTKHLPNCNFSFYGFSLFVTEITLIVFFGMMREISFLSYKAPVEEKEETSSTDASSLHQSETPNAADNAAPITVVVKSIPSPKKASVTRERSHETYRLLRRKNLIVEAVCNLRIIEGLFQ